MTRIFVLEKLEMNDEQRRKLENLGDVEWFDSTTEKEGKERVKDADVVLIDWINPNPFLDNMKTKSLLSLSSTGYAWVEIKKAKERSITVTNIPSFSTEAVAEHTLGLVLSVAKKITLGDRNMRSGSKEKANLKGFELKGKTIGIIGLGNIGKRVAEIAKGFGMNVLTYNRHQKNESGVKDVSLEDLLRTSDVVSINCPINEDSKNMINSEKLHLMKKEAILVGTTWNIVQIDALVGALKNGIISGAGLDVSIEGKDLELPKELLSLDNVVVTPHIAFNTRESDERRFDTCIENIKAFLDGKPKNVVN